MNSRETRRKIAEETLDILEKGFFISPSGKKIDIADVQKKAQTQTKVYSPADSDQLLANSVYKSLEQPTEIVVTHATTLNATRVLIEEGYKNALCLNFASAKNPGGGFLGGSQAQEESIARASGLYPCQIKASEYYETNRKTKSCIYTDYMIYSPYVPILKNEAGENVEELICCSIITAPAVNTGVVKKREPARVGDIETIMKRRIKKVLTIALEHHHTAIVLGAWGCGVFQNDPKDIARYFREILSGDFKDKFEKIVFAIYARNERFIQPFYDNFRISNDEKITF